MSTKKSKQPKEKEPEIFDDSDRKDNRYRLKPEEAKIIDTFRANGTVPDSSQILSDINKTNLTQKHSELKRRYSSSLEELNVTQQQLGTLIDMRNMPVKPYKLTPSVITGKSDSTLCVIASDWHIEETVDPSTVNNLNEFNTKVAKKRSETFFKKALLMHELVGKSFNVKNMILALIGDFINGYIHEENVEQNTMSPTQAIFEAKKMLISGIDFLLENTNFDQLIIPCCFGNHGRTTQKSRISSGYKNSFEWLMYKDLEMYYQNNPKIKFIVTNSYHAFVNLYDKYLLRFHHGDSIRFCGGVGGLTIPVHKAIAQWNKAIPAYLDVFGHWHQSIDGGNFISNGSLIGYNAYANFIKASFEPPQQSMFIINKDHGKIMSAPLFIS